VIYYFLPSSGIYGGIKVGFQLLAALRSLNVRAVAVTPDGAAPQWFATSVPVLSEPEAIGRLGKHDTVLFSRPHDHRRLDELNARLVFHCQGTDPLIDPIVDDPRVSLLACWPEAASYMRGRGRDDVREIGIAVADAFFYAGAPKYEATIAYMPRRGIDSVTACRRRVPHGRYLAIEGMVESQVAERMQRADIYLATSLDEWFGLPALEAMAAGCVVLSVPVPGGMVYLEDGSNCRVAEPAALPELLDELLEDASRPARSRLRAAARATASAYRLRLLTGRVREWLAAGPGPRSAS